MPKPTSRTGELAHHLARSLMQQAAQNQAIQDIPAEYEVCPGCSKAVERTDPQDRPLTTRAGEIEWSEPKRYCPSTAGLF